MSLFCSPPVKFTAIVVGFTPNSVNRVHLAEYRSHKSQCNDSSKNEWIHYRIGGFVLLKKPLQIYFNL